MFLKFRLGLSTGRRGGHAGGPQQPDASRVRRRLHGHPVFSVLEYHKSNPAAAHAATAAAAAAQWRSLRHVQERAGQIRREYQ